MGERKAKEKARIHVENEINLLIMYQHWCSMLAAGMVQDTLAGEAGEGEGGEEETTGGYFYCSV